METMKVDFPAELRERLNAELARFSRENGATLVIRPVSPVEDQPRH